MSIHQKKIEFQLEKQSFGFITIIIIPFGLLF